MFGSYKVNKYALYGSYTTMANASLQAKQKIIKIGVLFAITGNKK
jgi:hypothetical protein